MTLDEGQLHSNWYQIVELIHVFYHEVLKKSWFWRFRTRMVYLNYISCLRYTILVGNPQFIICVWTQASLDLFLWYHLRRVLLEYWRCAIHLALLQQTNMPWQHTKFCSKWLWNLKGDECIRFCFFMQLCPWNEDQGHSNWYPNFEYAVVFIIIARLKEIGQ